MIEKLKKLFGINIPDMPISNKARRIISAVLMLAVIAFSYQIGNGYYKKAYRIPEESLRFNEYANRGWKDISDGAGLKRLLSVDRLSQVHRIDGIDFRFISDNCEFSGAVMRDGELKDGKTRHELMSEMDEHLFEFCSDIQTLQEKKLERQNKKTIISSMHRCVYDGEDVFYRILWIEFDGSDKFVWAKFTTTPKHYEEYIKDFEMIEKTFKSTGR